MVCITYQIPDYTKYTRTIPDYKGPYQKEFRDIEDAICWIRNMKEVKVIRIVF